MPDFEFEIPKYAIVVDQGPDHKAFLGLMVSTSATMHTFYLCDASQAHKMADTLRDQILKAGQDARRQNSGIVVANGVPDGYKAQAAAKGR